MSLIEAKLRNDFRGMNHPTSDAFYLSNRTVLDENFSIDGPM